MKIYFVELLAALACFFTIPSNTRVQAAPVNMIDTTRRPEIVQQVVDGIQIQFDDFYKLYLSTVSSIVSAWLHFIAGPYFPMLQRLVPNINLPIPSPETTKTLLSPTITTTATHP